MPFYEYRCQDCQAIQDVMVTIDKRPGHLPCPACGGKSKQIITMRQTSPVDPGWIGTVREVVSKDPTRPHCQEFLKHATRANMNAWMKGEGLRPLEDNEPMEPKFDRAADLTEKKKLMQEANQRRTALEINS